MSRAGRPTFERGRPIFARDLQAVADRAFAPVSVAGGSIANTLAGAVLSILPRGGTILHGRVVARNGPQIGRQSEITYDIEVLGQPDTRQQGVTPAYGRPFDDDGLSIIGPKIRAQDEDTDCLILATPDGEGGQTWRIMILDERILTTQCTGNP